MRKLSLSVERWPLAAAFTIARGSKTEAIVVVATISEGVHVGRGECVPYARYGETVETVSAAIETARTALLGGCDRHTLQTLMKPGAARNAVDCALWDLEAKIAGRRASDLAGIRTMVPVTTAYTLSLGTPDAMHAAAKIASDRKLLKVKLGTADDAERIAAVRAGAPDAELIIDANEGWSATSLEANLRACEAAGVTLIEQPLPASDDAALAGMPRRIAICADESLHDRASLAGLIGKYDAINIKLDKAGGLTEALALAEAAQERGLSLMVGCMVSTSLAMAPAMLLAQRARVVDLDGPLLLKEDRLPGLVYEGSLVHPPTSSLWG